MGTIREFTSKAFADFVVHIVAASESSSWREKVWCYVPKPNSLRGPRPVSAEALGFKYISVIKEKVRGAEMGAPSQTIVCNKGHVLRLRLLVEVLE